VYHPHMPLPKFPFVVLDTETTGLIPRSDKVIELAIVRFEEGEKVAEYESLFTVDTTISPVARVLTRLTAPDLQGKPTITSELPRIEKLLQGAVIIGQNILFDIEMLKGESVPVENSPWIDSAMLASIVYPEAESYSLGYLSTFLNLPHEPKHRAMGDVTATTALLEKLSARFQELPKETILKLKNMGEKGPEGYAMFFAELEGGKKSSWSLTAKRVIHDREQDLPAPKKERTWLAVKNLDATLKEVKKIPYTPIFAPPFLLDPERGQALLAQERFTADELTLAIKLLLYSPKAHADFPLHGNERDVWNGKLACTKESKAYGAQFKGTGHVIVDHRQLLELLLHEHEHAPKEGEAIIMSDASMLEDTATKAFKWSCATDPLRAAAEGNPELTSFLDAYQMWLERVRNFQDIRYLVAADLTSKEAKGLRERMEALHATPLPELVQERLVDLQKILDPKNLSNRITYIEQFRDGGQVLQSVPLNIASALDQLLYEKYQTTLLLPPGELLSFASIVPPGAKVDQATDAFEEQAPLRYAEPELSLDRLLPRVDGKVVCLISSKREIEKIFVEHAERLEEQGITLIGQGLSGGQGRMQAEFNAAEDRAVWLITPWTYEGIELPPASVDHLWIATMPFDHPSNAILSVRAERYGGKEFDLYFVPRLLHRLFRILRTYAKHRKEDGDILILDQRLKQRAYGKRVMEYLAGLCSS